MINSLEIVFSYLLVARTPHGYIILIVRATFNSLIVSNTKNIIIDAKRYLIIKKILFTLRKEFATTSNRRKYYNYYK